MTTEGKTDHGSLLNKLKYYCAGFYVTTPKLGFATPMSSHICRHLKPAENRQSISSAYLSTLLSIKERIVVVYKKVVGGCYLVVSVDTQNRGVFSA